VIENEKGAGVDISDSVAGHGSTFVQRRYKQRLDHLRADGDVLRVPYGAAPAREAKVAASPQL
jgi:hypothetical protein